MENQDKLELLNFISVEQKGGSAKARTEKILAKLQQASSNLSEAADVEKIPDIISIEFKRFFSAPICLVSSWNEDEDRLTLLSQNGSKKFLFDEEADCRLIDYPFKASSLRDKRVKVLTIKDLDKGEKEAAYMKTNGFSSLLLIPMVGHNKVFGLIEIYDDHERDYEKFELIAARLLAAHSTMAFQTMRYAQRLERSFQEQEALHDASLAISSSLDINGILTKIAEEVCSLVDATSVYISSYDPELKISTGIAEFYGPNANERERITDIGKSFDHNYDFRDVIEMFKTGKPLVYLVDDLNLDESERRYIELFGGKSVMEIPLQVSGEFLGIIEIWDSQKAREFTQQEIYLCETIAQQAAIALRNAKLYQNAQDELNVRKDLEEKLRYDALHDVLTGLPNRLLFYDRLEQAILRHKRSSEANFAVLYVDLDRFKYVNDSFGHMVGDKVLVKAANAIKECVREGDTVSRFGGDEFLILLNGDINSQRVKKITDRIQANLKSLTIESDSQVFLSASIGLVVSSMEIETADQYLKSADIAMYAAKMKGGGRLEIFSPTKELRSKEKVLLQSEILRAAKQREFQIYFQPIVNLGTYEVVGFEALLRWQELNGNLVLPGEFIPLLEGLGLISEVGNWLISKAIKYYLKWQIDNPVFAEMSLSVNVSISQLIHPKFVQEIKKILESVNFDPSRLVIEVTESILINDLALVTDTLSDLRELGIKIHLDDFGTGFSSLSYLNDLPVNAIKIDRKFIEKIGPHLEYQGLLISILVMANDLGLDVIAEGIETEEQLITLIGLNCRLGQGFLFSPGMAADDVEEFVKDFGNDVDDFEYV